MLTPKKSIQNIYNVNKTEKAGVRYSCRPPAHFIFLLCNFNLDFEEYDYHRIVPTQRGFVTSTICLFCFAFSLTDGYTKRDKVAVTTLYACMVCRDKKTQQINYHQITWCFYPHLQDEIRLIWLNFNIQNWYYYISNIILKAVNIFIRSNCF